MDALRNFDIVQNSTGFDADWYSQTFPDAAAMGLSAAEHFSRIGARLGRGVSATNPRLEDTQKLRRALLRRPRISYCTPIMNRVEDLKATLADNLEANRPLADQLEFVLVFLDEDHAAHDWIRKSFAADLRSGYLRLIIEPTLDGWHFGRAKNRHRAYATGQIYSSLDGDNFVTLAETEQLLELADQQPDGFVFHHFTGRWGDGSSGRVSLPMPVYRRIGYDESFLPRQFDEMDVLLSALCDRPDLPLVRIRSAQHGFSGKRSEAFFKAAGMSNPVIELDPPERRDPINPKGADYVQADPVMDAMTSFNQGLSFMRNAPTQALREKYLRLTVEGRHQVIDALPPERILPTLFASGDHPTPEAAAVGPDEVSLFACMKNDDNFLPAFYDHYKARGITWFFIVDDGSHTPIAQTLPHQDVHVFHPKVGQFANAKGMWLDGLMKAYLRPGHWALSVDADEFIDLPVGDDSFPALAARLAARGQDMASALLIDVVPGPEAENFAEIETDFLSLMDHYVYQPGPPDAAYADTRSIQWGFGPYAPLSWHLDTRFHAFGTFDALRKIPLFRIRPGRHVNQGFHTLHHSDGTPDPGSEIWATDTVLPIRHFKLLKLFSEAARARMAAHVSDQAASPYHARTTANIARIFGSDPVEQIARIRALPMRPYVDNVLRTLDPRDYLTRPSI